ncbi:ATPase [Pedobacter polaris]|uniref:histidine kinase n=1 Tax=Pedobacter polaris TaxID=2571273 RepID=A0A4V5NYT6_9SPHI|nr:PAS domain-containing sensor histidine kinase [Pedobacter polaris]TKC05407.1 ATPase [Pedobacter polaris]
MNELNTQLFCQMGEISKDGFFIYSTIKQNLIYFNKGLTQIWNATTAEIEKYPKILVDAVHAEDQSHAYSCYQECIADMTAKKYEIRLLLNQKEKYVRFSIFPFVDQVDTILCGIVEDTTVDKHNKIYIEQINAHKNITLEVLSHDLKEPLGMMRLTASAMEGEVAKTGNSRMTDSLIFIKEMCERNIKLVRSMINREFVKSSVVELKKERTDIVWELQDVLRFYRRSHLRDLKEFRFSSSDEKIYLPLDTMKFMQVVNNLISNAIKFTIYGGIIELSVKNKEKSVVVSVADNGIGIPKEAHATLFHSGTKGLKLGLSGENSGGLGMRIIKTIVELHEGVIWFESEEGKGSVFHIELPK